MTREEEEEKIKLIKLGKEEDISNENLNIEQPTNKRTSFFRSTGATGLTATQQKIAPQIVGESYDSYNNSILEAEKEFQHVKDVSPNRDMLVNQYKAYSDQVARDISNQDNVRYQKDKIVMDLIGSELSRTANIGTYAQDVFNEIGGEARLATADAYRNVAKAATNLEVASDGFNADRLYNIATQAAGTDISKIGTADMTGTNYNVKMYDMLKDLYERHPNDRTIEYVYNLVTKKGYTGDEDIFKNTVPYLNQVLKQDKYNQSVLVRNTEDEIQYVQNLKQKEALSDYGDLANWGLTGVGVASYMIPSVAAGVATAGVAEGLSGAGLISASEVGINTASQIGSLGSMYMSSAGRAFDETIKAGYDWDRASLYSQLMGALEVTTELIGGENVMSFVSGKMGGTALSKATQELVKKGGNAASRFLIGMAADIGGEIIEEEISALVEPIIDKAVLGKDTTIEEYLQSALSAATDTVLPTLIMGGLGKARIANSVTKTQTRLNTKIDALLSSNVITKEEADNLKKIVSDWTNNAIDGVYEREEEIKNKLGTINYKQTYDEAMGNINAQLNQKLMTNNIVQNPEYASNREIQDLGTKVEVSYKNKATIESDIETLMKDNPSIKSMTPATTISKMQQTIKTFLEKVTGKQVVYVNIENAPNEFDYGFTNKKGNNLYLNSKLDTADTLAAGFHEAGHHFAKTYDNLFKKFNSKISDTKVNELKKKSVFKGLDSKGIREELFGNYLGSVLTNAKTTKKLEKSTQTLVENVKDMFNFMSKNSDSKVSQYNTDYINYLGDAIVKDKALEKAVLDTFKLSAKENKGNAAEVSEEVASKVDTKALREERLKKALERNANKTETEVEKETPPKRLEAKKSDGKSKEKVAKPSNSSKENKKEESKAAKTKTGLRQQLVKNMVKQLSEMEITPHNIEEVVAEQLEAATEKQLEKLFNQYNLSQRTLNRLQGKIYNEVEKALKTKKIDIKYSRLKNDNDGSFILPNGNVVPATDNLGNELTADVQKRFQNSKDRDRLGQLLELYHTMTNRASSPYDVFEPEKTPGYKFRGQTAIYTTSSKDVSNSYAGTRNQRNIETVRRNRVESIAEAKYYIPDSVLSQYKFLERDGKIVVWRDLYGDLKKHEKPNGEVYYTGGVSKIFETEEDFKRNFVNWLYKQENVLPDDKKYWQFPLYMNSINPLIFEGHSRAWNRLSDYEILSDVEEELQDLRRLIVPDSTGFGNELTDVSDKVSYGIFKALANNSSSKTAIENYVDGLVEELNSKENYQMGVLPINGFKELANYIKENREKAIKNVETKYNVEWVKYVTNEGTPITQRILAKRIADSLVRLAMEDIESKMNLETNHIVKRALKYNYEHNVANLKNTYEAFKKLYDEDAEVVGSILRNQIPNNMFNVDMKVNKNEVYQNVMRELKNIKVEGIGEEQFESFVKELEKNPKIVEQFIDYFNRMRDMVSWKGYNDTALERVKEMNRYGGTIEDLRSLANRFAKDEFAEFLSDYHYNTSQKEILEVGGYDGVIIKSVYDYGGEPEGPRHPADLYIAFDSSQVKLVDNPTPTSNPDIRYSRTITEDNEGKELSEGQQEWNEGNKVVDSKGRLKHLYHGTNNGEFYIFDPELASVEGDWGAGFYLTDDELDVNTNYYGGGPDFENKVSRLAERIQDQSDTPISFSVAEERAREILEKGEYRIDAYGKMLNPAIVGETKLFQVGYDDLDVDRDEYETEDEYYEELEYARYDKLNDMLDDALSAIRAVYGSGVANLVKDSLPEFEFEDGIGLQKLKDKLNEALIEDDEGNLIGNELARLIIQSQGYDGIIDPTVSQKFNMNLDSDTTHYIFFEPNQIKDVDNLNPTDNPDIHYSKAQSKATKELLKKVRMTEDEDELQTFVDNTFVRIMRRINREIFNNAEALVQFDNKVAKAMGKKIADVPTFLKLFDNWRRAGNSDSIIAQIAKGAYDDVTGKKLTKGLANIIGDLVPSRKEARAMGMSRNEAIQYRIEQLIALGVAERAQELEERDIESGIDYDVRQAVMEEYKDDAKLHKALQEIREDGSALIDYLAKKHVLQEETANIIKENNLLYFPFNRVLSEDTTRYGFGKKDGAVGRAIVGIKGSDLRLENPLVSIVGNWARMLQVIDQQTMIEKMKEAGKYLGKQEGLYFEDVKPLIKYQGEVGMDIFKGNIATQLENLGYDDVVDRLDWNSLYQLFVPEKADPKKMTISYFDEKGKRKYIKFADNDYGKPLFDILSNLNPMQSNKFLDFVNLLSQGIRLGATTMNWEFALGNMMSDSAQAYLYSEGFVVPLVSSIFDIYKLGVGRGYVPAFKKDYADYYEKFKRSGASLSGQFRGNSKYIRGKSNEVFGFTEDQLFGSMGLKDAKNFRDVRKTLKKNAGKILNNISEFLQFVPEYSEEATRFAEFVRVYDKMIKKGWTQENAIKEAGIKAREITQDFSIQGNTMKSVNKVIPFSAATMGGLYRFGRELKTHPVRLTSRLTIMAAFVLLMLETFRDDDDRKWYEEMNKQKKFDNYVINNGTSEPIIIKKPQGPARYFVNFVELIYNIVNGYVEEDKIGEAVKDWAEMSAKDQLPITNASDFVPGGLQAFLENEVNRDFYYGSAIVPQSLEKLEPRHQYNESTSEFAKALGDIFNWSPLKIDNVVKSSFAGLGKLFLEATDEAAAMFGANEKPSKSKGERYLIDKFYANALKNPESVNYVYDRFEELETEKAEGRMTAKEQREYEKLSVAKSTLADINKQIKEIKGNEKLSGTKKTEKIEDLKEMQVDVARYYTGKPLIEKSNKAKIELMEYYPSQDTYIYTVNKDNKVNLDFSSNALKTEYAKMFKEKYDELLKELKASSEYQQATATTKVTLEKETKTKARTATTNDMKKIVFERTKG